MSTPSPRALFDRIINRIKDYIVLDPYLDDLADVRDPTCDPFLASELRQDILTRIEVEECAVLEPNFQMIREPHRIVVRDSDPVNDVFFILPSDVDSLNSSDNLKSLETLFGSSPERKSTIAYLLSSYKDWLKVDDNGLFVEPPNRDKKPRYIYNTI